MTSPAATLPDYAPIPSSALGPALNDPGYYVGRVERNLYWVTDGVYQAAFLTTRDGVVVFDAPPTIGGNIRRAVDEIAAANGVTNRVTHLVYSHHHDDHSGAASLFDSAPARRPQERGHNPGCTRPARGGRRPRTAGFRSDSRRPVQLLASNHRGSQCTGAQAILPR